MNQDGPKHLDITLTRAKFDELTADLVDKTMGPVRNALADAGLTAGELDKVLLVGGSTRIPAVQDAVKKITGKEPFKGINPDECVAIGASIQVVRWQEMPALQAFFFLTLHPFHSYRDSWRRSYKAYRKKYYNTYKQETDFLNCRG